MTTSSTHSHPRGAGTGAHSKDEAALLAASAHLTNRDRWLVRLDTGTEHLPQLTGKLPGYAEMARVNMTFQVPILFCFPTPRREQTARTAMAATRASHDLQIATAALDPRLTCPACGPAWMPLHGGSGPIRLIDLDDVLPDPWRVARTRDAQEGRDKARHELDDDDPDIR
jgi:hypothetical protein